MLLARGKGKESITQREAMSFVIILIFTIAYFLMQISGILCSLFFAAITFLMFWFDDD